MEELVTKLRDGIPKYEGKQECFFCFLRRPYILSKLKDLKSDISFLVFRMINVWFIPVFSKSIEQKAIVQNVESLLEKCRILETEIENSERSAEQLMKAVLKEAFDTT